MHMHMLDEMHLHWRCSIWLRRATTAAMLATYQRTGGMQEMMAPPYLFAVSVPEIGYIYICINWWTDRWKKTVAIYIWLQLASYSTAGQSWYSVGARKGYIARTVLTVVAMHFIRWRHDIFLFSYDKKNVGGELGEDDDRGRSKGDDTRRQKRAKLSASRQRLLLVMYRELGGSAWLLECRQRNRPFFDVYGAACIFSSVSACYYCWIFEPFDPTCTSSGFRTPSHDDWTDWYDGTIYLERITDWNSHCVVNLCVLLKDRPQTFASFVEISLSRQIERYLANIWLGA
jgi:hypothetical protein